MTDYDDTPKWPTGENRFPATLYATVAKVDTISTKVTATEDNMDRVAEEVRYPSTQYCDSRYATIGSISTGGVDLTALQTISKMDLDPEVDTTANTTHYPSVAYVALHFAPKNHTHDMSTFALANSVYTKTAVDAALSGKSDTTHTHTDYALVATTYTKAEIDAAMSGKQATGTYVTADVSTLTNFYDKTTSDGKYATVAGAGITKTQGDTYYAPITGSTEYATVTNLAAKANSSDVTTALATKASTTHNHDTTYAVLTNPANGQNNYAGKDYVDTLSNAKYTKTAVDNFLLLKAPSVNPVNGQNNYAGKDYVDTQLATKQASGSYIDANVTALTNFYDKATSDGKYATVGSSGITKTQGDTYYAAITHNHTGVYQPVGSYLVAADIAGKANASDVYTKAQSDGKYLTTDDDSAYQTRANMVVVGSETTYYSGAKVDALIAAGGGSGSVMTGTLFADCDYGNFAASVHTMVYNWNDRDTGNSSLLSWVLGGTGGTQKMYWYNNTANALNVDVSVQYNWGNNNGGGIKCLYFYKTTYPIVLVNLTNNGSGPLPVYRYGSVIDYPYSTTAGLWMIQQSNTKMRVAAGECFCLVTFCTAGTAMSGVDLTAFGKAANISMVVWRA